MKEKSLISYYGRKFNNSTFDEKDVLALLVLIKKYYKDIPSIHELGEMATKREQYQGLITNYIFETRRKFASIGQTKAALRIHDVFPFKEIRNGLNKIMADFQLIELTNEKINDFVTCLISILQQVKIMDENNKEIGKLFFAISEKQVILMVEIEVSQNLLKKTNVVFPVLTANNNYSKIKKQDRYDTPYLLGDEVVDVTNQDGKLELIFTELVGR